MPKLRHLQAQCVGLEDFLDALQCCSFPVNRPVAVPMFQPGFKIVRERNGRPHLFCLLPLQGVEANDAGHEVDLAGDMHLENGLWSCPQFQAANDIAKQVLTVFVPGTVCSPFRNCIDEKG
jgi:hypothetical protein